MRYPILIACTTVSLSAWGATPAVEPQHVFVVASLPAGVQTLLQERHGDIPDRFSKLSNTCLVDDSFVGQRLAAATVAPDRVQVEIEHARKRELTRLIFRLEGGAWTLASTESVLPAKAAQAAFAAAFQKMGKRRPYTPLPTDGTIAVTVPRD